MKKAIVLFVFLSFSLCTSIWAQFSNESLYHFKFAIQNKSDIDQITQIISIDNVIRDTVYAYANEVEFNNFNALNIPYRLITETKSAKAILMATTLSQMANWDKYPTYEVYIAMMQQWATQYPNLCVLEEIGTLPSGKKMLALKISDNPTLSSENEPALFLSSTIHGDEIAGYVILLRLIDYMLNQYNSNNPNHITQLINKTEIWISPLTNPDGAYKGGNSTLSGAWRYNGNSVDLNRNFPDAAVGENPDRKEYQPETLLMMDFAAKHNFSMGANIHAGEEVANYPWDTWSKRAPDDIWWKYVAGNYRDSAQNNSPSGYFTGVSSGLTNGYDWFRITGGRQDYMNYFHRCREFTIEISDVKLYSSTDLPNLWNYNRGALLGFITESLYGIHGNVINNLGNAVKATVEVLNYDKDNSQVFTDSATGFFTRYLKEGTYNLKITADGYADGLVSNITVVDGQQTYVKHILNPIFSKICVDTNEIVMQSIPEYYDTIPIPLINCGNTIKYLTAYVDNYESIDWIVLIHDTLTLLPQQENSFTLSLSNPFENDTTFTCNLIIEADSTIKIPITVNFVSPQPIKTNKTKIHNNLIANTLIIDSLYFENLTNKTQQIIINPSTIAWLKYNTDTFVLDPFGTYNLKFEVNTNQLTTGFYVSDLTYNATIKHSIPLSLSVDAPSSIEMQKFRNSIFINKNDIYIDSFQFTNKGGGLLDYNLKIADLDLQSKIELIPATITLDKQGTQTLHLKINSTHFNIGKYNSFILAISTHDTVRWPINITIDTLPKLIVSTDTISINTNAMGLYKDSIRVENQGGNRLEIEALENITHGYKLINLPEKILAVAGKKSTYIPFSIETTNLLPGKYYSSITINSKQIQVVFNFSDAPALSISKPTIVHSMEGEEIRTDTIFLTNNSNAILNFTIENNSESTWFKTNVSSGEIVPGNTQPIVITINCKGLVPENYYGNLLIKSNSLTRIPLSIKVLQVK